jgi:NurA-like 5'-3' nuclease
MLNLLSRFKVFLEDRIPNTFARLDKVNSIYKVILTETLNGIGRF